MKNSVVVCLVGLLATLESVTGFSCTFDNDLCGFTQRTDDKFDWRRHKGRTSSGGTGPNTDHTTGKGYYMYIEASSKQQGDNALLERAVTLSGDNVCLTFYYHMMGRHIGTLNVYVGSYKVFSQTGQTGQSPFLPWNKAEIPVHGSGNQKLVFEGIISKGFQGDIAIDDVSVGKCSDKATPMPPRPTTKRVTTAKTETQPPPTPPTPPTQPPVTTPVPPTPTPTPQPTPTTPMTPPGTCGVRPHTRIVGGVNAKQGDWPWQAQLRNVKNYPFCGGTLIHPQWVVTATHCLVKKVANNEQIHVRFGAHHRTRPNNNIQDIKVVKMILHPSYHKPIKYAYDVALVKLEKPAVLNKFVNLACLPENKPDPVEGTQCWITGFGAISPSGWLPNYMRQASVPIVGKQRCLKAYPNRLHESMMCGGYDEGGIDSCQGDSGGPLVCETEGRYFLYGVTSWGVGCGSRGNYGVYSRVTHLLSWLKTQMARG